MKQLKYILAVCIVAVFAACSEDDLGPSIIDTSTPERTELEQWIVDTYTIPYNIEVFYRWDERETDRYYYLIPPKLEFVYPMLDIVERAWINPYVRKGGLEFFKQYCPKQIYLTGSPGVNDDGTITQGTAEGGIKIVLYQINDFNKKDKTMLLRYFHIMHHEFGHILHQNKFYDSTYQSITSGYTSEWYLKEEYEAYQLGYITNYAMASPDEDFVEMIAMMLTRSKTEWEDFLKAIENRGEVYAAAVVNIRKKEAIVIDYFKNSWGIDIFELQADIYEQIEIIMQEDE